MASEKPGSVEHDRAVASDFEQSLMSMEKLDRSSPELWPEKYPGMTKFINSFTPPSATKLPYSREMNQEDQNYLHQLAALPTAGLVSKVKELHDIAYQLGVEESKEVTRGKYLNLFKSRRHKYALGGAGKSTIRIVQSSISVEIEIFELKFCQRKKI